MSIQTTVGAPNLDASDFQLTYAGNTVGVELRRVPTPDGEYVTTALGAVLVSGVWTYSTTLAQEFLTEMGNTIESVTDWLKTVLIPAINAWLKTIFTGVVVVPPTDNLPAGLKILDGLMPKLKVVVVDNVPQVSL